MSNLILLRRGVVTDIPDFLFTVRAIGDDWRHSCGSRAWYGVFEEGAGGESSTDKADITRSLLSETCKKLIELPTYVGLQLGECLNRPSTLTEVAFELEFSRRWKTLFCNVYGQE